MSDFFLQVHYSAVMYPNPTDYEVNIKILDPSIEVTEIYVYNFSGVLSKTYNLSKNNRSDIYNLDVSMLISGVYIFKLKTTKNTYIDLKLIIRR